MKLKELRFTADERSQMNRYLRQIDQNIAKEDMTPLDRMDLTMKHKEPDRVPVCISSMEYTSRSIGATIREILKEPKKAVLANLGTVAMYACDTVCSAYADPHVIGPEEIGTKVIYPEDGTPILKDFIVKEMRDIEKLEIPDPWRDGKLPMVLQVIESLRDKIGDKVPIWQCLNGPFGHAGDIRGYAQLMRDLIQNPEMVHALMEFCTEVAITIAKAVQAVGATPWPFDAMSAPEFIGKKRYFDFVYPYQKRMIQSLTPPGSLLGIDGDVSNIIKEYAATGALAIHIDGGLRFIGKSGPDLNDLMEFKRQVGHKTTFLVQYIKTSHLSFDIPNKIGELVKEVVNALASGGGFVLETDVIPLDASVENVKAVMEAAKRYGKYPIIPGK